MNQFFGEENWEYISRETKESMVYSERVTNSIGCRRKIPGNFQNWYIRFKNRNGTEQTSIITDHVLKINHNKYGHFSFKRLSTKQAFYMGLMDISLEMASQEIFNEIIRSELSQKEANCFSVYMGSRGDNPKPKFYNALSKEPWFTADKVTAENYLSWDLGDFYIEISDYKYRLDELTDQERQNVFDSLKNIEKKLLEKYGDNASFEICFDEEYQVEYIDGCKK